MRVKRYLAKSLPEAMAQVRSDLGLEAVILYTSQVRMGGLFGLFGRRMVQVMAAVEGSAGTVSSPASAPAAASAPAPSIVAAPWPEVTLTPPLAAFADSSPPGSMAELAAMHSKLDQVVERLSLPSEAGALEPDLFQLLTLMLRGGVESADALALIAKVRGRLVKSSAAWSEAPVVAREIMVKELGKVQTVDFGRRVVALVGPTGVGKTTTLAKMAAHFALKRRMRVSLVTADTYRIAAVDQLRTYSQILGVPLEVIYDPRDVKQALARQTDRDILLVDTAGRSPGNPKQMEELRTYLAALQPDETYLVISLTSAYRDALRIVDSYLPARFDRFLFTKWDEAAGAGLIYTVARRYKRPLSYITTGQVVPDDIEKADPEKIVRLILGAES